VVLVFSSETGELLTIFQDEGYLTDVRTAAAGAVAAKYLAPRDVECIGIIGAGLQARLQLEYLREVTACRRVKLWARSMERARALSVPGFDIEVSASAAQVAAHARLIALARVRAVDSLSQCAKYGDSAFALEQGLIEAGDLVELGRLIQDASLRRGDGDITIADLTGVAVQDMAVAELALQELRDTRARGRAGA